MTTRRGRPRKGVGESPVQLDITFKQAEFEGEILHNHDSGKRRVVYRNCVFTGECRTGAYCTLINPGIKGTLRTGGDTRIINPLITVSGVLIPGASNIVSL